VRKKRNSATWPNEPNLKIGFSDIGIGFDHEEAFPDKSFIYVLTGIEFSKPQNLVTGGSRLTDPTELKVRRSRQAKKLINKLQVLPVLEVSRYGILKALRCTTKL
jgi:hypothetical protein